MKRRAKLVWGVTLGVGLAGGAALTLYLFTGFGSYDLPPMARQKGENIKAAEKAGMWITWPTSAPTAMTAGDFWRLAEGIDRLAPQMETAGITAAQASARRKALANQVSQAQLVAQVKDVAWVGEAGFPKLANLKLGGKVLALDAKLAAKTGQVDEAIESVEAVLELSRLAASNSHSIAVLVAIAIDQMAYAAAAEIASDWQGKPESLRRLKEVLAQPRWTVDLGKLARADEFVARQAFASPLIKSEAWVSTDMFNGLQEQFDEDGFFQPFPRFKVPARMVDDAIVSRHYHSYARLISAADDGWDELLKVSGEIDKQSADPKSMTWVASSATSYALTPRILKANEARRHALVSGVGMMIDPKTKPAEDPFAPGQSLRVSLQADGFAVYSVGVDGKDNRAEFGNGVDLGYEFKVKP